MTPLDLTRQPPRSCRVAIGGIAYLARAIDKTRAELPGGALGAYLVLHPRITTISDLFYRRMAITHDEFTAAVRDAATDDDVAAWLHGRVDPERIDRWHRQLNGLRIADIPAPAREAVLNNHPIARTMPETTSLVEMFDADDAALFARP